MSNCVIKLFNIVLAITVYSDLKKKHQNQNYHNSEDLLNCIFVI